MRASLCVFGNLERMASAKTPPSQGGEKTTRSDDYLQEDNWSGCGKPRQQPTEGWKAIWRSCAWAGLKGMKLVSRPTLTRCVPRHRHACSVLALQQGADCGLLQNRRLFTSQGKEVSYLSARCSSFTDVIPCVSKRIPSCWSVACPDFLASFRMTSN